MTSKQIIIELVAMRRNGVNKTDCKQWLQRNFVDMDKREMDTLIKTAWLYQPPMGGPKLWVMIK